MENEVIKKNKKEKIFIIIGFVLIIVAIFILFLNESKSVDSEKVISIAKDSYIEVSSSKIDKNNDGKLVVVSGKIDLINDNVSDQDFNVSVRTAKLVRVVEMYQWDKVCESKEDCSYKKVWSSNIIDDSKFESGYVNPDTMPYLSSELYMSNVNLGEYILEKELLSQLSITEVYKDLDEKIAKNKGLNIVDGMYTTYDENNNLEIGDIRISFLYNNATDISVMAVQKDKKFEKFSPDGTNYEIFELREKIIKGKEFLNGLTKSNSMLRWILRLVGTILMIVGIAFVLKFMSFLASIIPFLEKFIVKRVLIVSILVGFSLSLLIIAISWFVVKPLISIILILIIVGLIILYYKYNMKKNSTEVKE